MQLVLTFYMFLMGAAFGSFSNMLVYRLKVGQNILGYSYCDHTKKRLKPIDLIPIFSYLFFAGKCRDCGKKLPILYPIIELLNALTLGLVFYTMFDRVDFSLLVTILILVQGVFVLAVYDYLYWSIPKYAEYFVLIPALIIMIINANWVYGPINMLAISGVLLLIKAIIAKSGFTLQEVLIIGALGLIFTYVQFVWFLVIVSFSGFVLGSLRVIYRKERIADAKIQLFPLLYLGLIVVLTLLY